MIAIDRFDYRLRLAQQAGAETVNYEEVDDVVQIIKDMTANIGPDSCIDAVGMEAHDNHFMYLVDRTKQAMKIETDSPIVLRQCIQACRKGGTISVPGVYAGFDDKLPMGAYMNKALAMKTGQTHMMRYMKPLLEQQRQPNYILRLKKERKESQMAGLTIDDAMPRIIDAKTHGITDYIHAGTNFLVAALFRKNKRARNAALALGAGVLANTLMTDYPLGVFRVYSFKVHGILDYGVAATSAALPTLLRIEDTAEAKYFRTQGAGETVIAGITDYDDDSGSVRRRRRLERPFERRRAA